jgi:DNA-binding transcriptional LysR family regulator
MSMEDILVFVRVAEALSFKDAARQLSISRSQASKRIAALEDDLGTPLIYRSTRSISLTGAGETLLAYYRRIFAMMEEAHAAVEHLNDVPVGRLRFSIPTCLVDHLLPKLYEDFQPRHTRLQLDAHVSENAVDIVSGGYDVVLRIAQRLTDSTLTARRLATSPLVLAASPAHLVEHGTLADVAQLSTRRCLGLDSGRQPATAWQFRATSRRCSVPVTLAVISNTYLSLVRAAVAGTGFIYVPRVVIAAELQQGTLQEVLPESCAGIDWGIYAVHAGRTPTRNAAAFIEFVRSMLPGLNGVETPRPFVARPNSAEKNAGVFR